MSERPFSVKVAILKREIRKLDASDNLHLDTIAAAIVRRRLDPTHALLNGAQCDADTAKEIIRLAKGIPPPKPQDDEEIA